MSALLLTGCGAAKTISKGGQALARDRQKALKALSQCMNEGRGCVREASLVGTATIDCRQTTPQTSQKTSVIFDGGTESSSWWGDVVVKTDHSLTAGEVWFSAQYLKGTVISRIRWWGGTTTWYAPTPGELVYNSPEAIQSYVVDSAFVELETTSTPNQVRVYCGSDKAASQPVNITYGPSH